MRRSELVGLVPSKKRRYMVASKSGFTRSCKDKMRENGVTHWTLDDVVKMLT